VAIITGSESGIGKAIAVLPAETGFDLDGTVHQDRSHPEQTAEEVRAAGRRAEMRPLNPTELPGACCAAQGGLGLLPR
jgi:NAD(P)-dependent dehydrogenase (short-subunit alcohol dehydrogenase family)